MLRPETQMMLNILDFVGAFAFSISGAMAAVKARMDYFGIFVLASVTTFGGGVLRDLLLNLPPAALFQTPAYLIVCAICTILVLLVASHHIELYMPIILIFDALGLAVFSTIGTLAGIRENTPWYTCILLAVITGCAGGIMRDLLRQEKPVILYSDFYAGLSMLGSLLLIACYVWGRFSLNMAVFLSCAFIFISRLTVLHLARKKNKKNIS